MQECLNDNVTNVLVYTQIYVCLYIYRNVYMPASISLFYHEFLLQNLQADTKYARLGSKMPSGCSKYLITKFPFPHSTR